MSRKPLIGCTTYRKTSEQVPPLELFGLMPSYIRAVVAAGGLPVMIPLGLDEEDLCAIFQRVDGLLIPGGGDIEPERYGGQLHPTVYGIDKDRDRVEFFLAQQAVQQDKPLLAICRGLQVFNVALGGSLWEDVHSLMPASMRHAYYLTHPRNYLAHTVQLAPNSVLRQQLAGQETSWVNSLHHQGINHLAGELTPVATATDGLIEGVEVSGHRYAVGVQWHPENLIDDDPVMLGLFTGLMEAAVGLR